MPTLYIGVIDVPYAPGSAEAGPKLTKQGRLGKRTAKRLAKQAQTGIVQSATQTTGDVATALEEKYHLFEIFVRDNEEAIQKAITHNLEGALDDLVMGAPIDNPWAGAGQEITDGLKTWMSLGLIEEDGVAGVPTKAAIERRSLRFKHKTGPAQRPSFVDTGTLEGSAIAWIE